MNMQLTKDLFVGILSNNESHKIDFKRDQYLLGDDRQKSEFIKDIVTIANTKGTESGYIVLGVKSELDGNKVKVGITHHFDDAMLQQIVKDKVNPPPTFEYHPYQEDDVSFGIIVILKSKDRPHVITRDYGILKKNAIYIRRGSSTDEATREELEEMILERCPKVREGELPTLARFLQENLLKQVEIYNTSLTYKVFSIENYTDIYIDVKDINNRHYSIHRPAITAISKNQKTYRHILFLDKTLESYNDLYACPVDLTK